MIALEFRVMITGALAAAVTPLAGDGEQLDEAAVEPLIDFLAEGGLDGVLALGTTGEGILLSVAERRRIAELIVSAAGERLSVAVHVGAQTTADTVELAAHAGETGAAAVAVIGPPYFAYDDAALIAHFAAAAAACDPSPFYLYEFAARAGYSIPQTVISELCDTVPNLRGMKVSNTPWDAFEPYLLRGLDVFVGPEALIHAGMKNGAIGAVSGLASAFPEVVAGEVRAPSAEGTNRIGELRASLQAYPLQAALKRILSRRGVPIMEVVRRPLRGLRTDERLAVDGVLDSWLEGREHEAG